MARTQLQALETRAQEMVGPEEAAIFGAHLSVLPDAREKKRLESAMRLEERAVA